MQPAERTRPPRAHSFWYPDGLGDPVDVTGDSEILPSRAFAGAAGGAGALAGDVPSLARWGHELFGGHILQANSRREMATFHDGPFWDGYGLGLALDRTTTGLCGATEVTASAPIPSSGICRASE